MRYSPLSGSEGSWPNVSSLGYYCTTFPPLSLSLSEGAHWEVNESRSQWGVYTRKMECYFKAKTTVRERDAAEPSSERGLFSRKFSALIQIQPDIHSHPMGPVPLHPRRCFFWGPPLSTRRHAVQKRCPCIVLLWIKSHVILDPPEADSTKLDLKWHLLKPVRGLVLQPRPRCILTVHQLMKDREEKRTRQDGAARLMSFTCGHLWQRRFKTGQEKNEKRLESVWAVSEEWGFSFGLFSVTTDGEERTSGCEGKDGGSEMAILCLRPFYYTDDKTKISEIWWAGLLITAHMTPTSFPPAKQR